MAARHRNVLAGLVWPKLHRPFLFNAGQKCTDSAWPGLVLAGHSWVRLTLEALAGSGWQWLALAGPGWPWLALAGPSWHWLAMNAQTLAGLDRTDPG